MAERNDQRDHGRDSMMRKAATLGRQAVTEDDLALINQLAAEEMTADQVFTFKAVLCDNKLDRHFERFTRKALDELRALFMGKTVIKDHNPSADNQVARIYKTELVTSATELVDGTTEPYTQLVAHCYMLTLESNADLIAEIKGGIKKEGSVGFRVSSAICSICGTDNAKKYCRHWPGKTYDKDEGKVLCTFTLDGASDAYEFSLVAVPAQRAAGVSKSYTGKTEYEPETPDNPPAPPEPGADPEAAKELEMRARYVEARLRSNASK
ncbi:MAG: hypothetical protein IKY89_05555 [Alistipes sp.]|nr:hypothetical protein [Alistipes sp.]